MPFEELVMNRSNPIAHKNLNKVVRTCMQKLRDSPPIQNRYFNKAACYRHGEVELKILTV